jgi:hypothetical protein
MTPPAKFNSGLEEEYSPIESHQQQFLEIDIDYPKHFPMRRRNKQRLGGVQKKHKREEKRINSRLKYQIEW